MPLDNSYIESVAFVVAHRRVDGVEVVKPIGTAFFVSVPSTAVPDGVFVYVVTAAHVVENEAWTGIRFNTLSGAVIDEPVPRWYFHPSQDVAAAPMAKADWVRLRFVPQSGFADRWDHRPNLGDPVYFAGLLAKLSVMGEANIPMVRSGTLGRLFQDNVPIQLADGVIRTARAHLIDCRSYAGFSGSPCFIQSTVVRHVDTPSIPGGAIGDLEFSETFLLGLIAAHFDEWVEARTTGDILGTVETPVNSGVGVVVPAEAIRELIELDPDLAAYRMENDARRRSANLQGPAALPG